MDSRVVNKLIRSEVWPLLRSQGFSGFESRTAFRYLGSFINVVNFQSFNSHLAEGLGCTTFSFGLNLGVYVVGCAQEDLVKKDDSGLLRPREYECSFRTSLRKRAPVDGFERDDIFYIDPEGQTAASCFQEARRLLTDVAPVWFERLNDLETIISWMLRAEKYPSDGPADAPLSASHGSLIWQDVLATLLLLKHSGSPTPESAEIAFREINRAIGALLDFPASLETAVRWEMHVLRIRQLWERLGSFAPLPSTALSLPSRSSLVGSAWAPVDANRMSGQAGDRQLERLSIREHFGPILKNRGFTGFTERLAHRICTDSIEVVEVAPVDKTESKTWRLPQGLFRIGVGIFWPRVGEEGLFRRNRDGNPAPKVAECHLTNWLVPAEGCFLVRTAFGSTKDAQQALEEAAFPWFNIFGRADAALAVLRRDDWEIFWNFPMMQGYGAKPSTRRLVLMTNLAYCLRQLGEAREYFSRAERAIGEWYPEHLRARYRKWIDDLRPNFDDLPS